jgi:hypothetical protein
MAEFNLRPRLESSHKRADDPETLLEQYADSYDGVTTATEATMTASPDGVVVPDSFLEIEGVETFAEVYTAMVDEAGVTSVSLSGPTADRFPVRVQHYALQQLSQPDLYEFHALDGQTTLVIAESEREAELVKQDVPGGALG